MKENWTCQAPKLQKIIKWKNHKHHLLKILYVRALCERNKHFTSFQINYLSFLTFAGWFWDHGRDVCQLCPLLSPYTAGVVQEPRGHRLPAEILQSHQQVNHKSTKHVITSEWEENLENINTAVDVSHHSDSVRLQQQRTAYLKLMSCFETNCLRTRGMLSIPVRI